MSSFDPYYDWLGIPPADQPPHHYRLLGLQALEGNARVIENAADRLMAQLRGFAAGPNGKDSQKLLNEVAGARACLLDAKRKAEYDKALKARLESAAPRPQVTVQYVQVPVQVPVPVPVPTAMPPMPSAAPTPPPPAEENMAPQWPGTTSAPFTVSTSRSRGRYGKGGGTSTLRVVLGGLGVLAVVALGVGVFLGADSSKLFQQPQQLAANSAAANSKRPSKPKPVVNPDKPAANPLVHPAPSPAETPAAPAEPLPSPAIVPTPVSETPPPNDPVPLPTVATTAPMELPVEQTSIAAPTDERRAPPTSEEQQAKLAELKEIYQAEFESGLKPAGREAFVDFLLATTERVKSDPIARFVLLREAYSRLITAKEFEAAAEIIDRLDAEFAMDPFKLRLHLLAEASTAARLPADRLAIVLCASELVEQALSQQRIGEADKFVRIAEGQAKTLSDSKLRARMTAQKVEVEKLVEAWGPVERARQTLASDPNNAPAALIDGRYRCLVEGDWKAGLLLLAQGADQPLAVAATQDLAGAGAEVTAKEIADRWYEIACADKELEGFYARARHWYQQVPAGGENLDQARLQKRIEEIEALGLPQRLLGGASDLAAASVRLPSFYAAYAKTQTFEPVDLFAYLHPQDLMASPWGATDDSPPVLHSDDETSFGRLPVRYSPPREYQLTIRVRRGQMDRPGFEAREDRATGPLVVGLVGPKSQFVACIDLPITGGEYASFLSVASAKTPADNVTLRRLSIPQIPERSDATIVCQVRRKSVSITISGNEVCRYEGDLSKLGLPKEWSVNDPKLLFIGSHQCGYSVTGWMLDPLPVEPSQLDVGGVIPSARRPVDAFAPPLASRQSR